MAKKKITKKETPAQRLSRIIKTCRQIMRKDKGMNGDADRLSMLTWLMFLKFMVEMLNPQLNETILDLVYGTGGFQVSAFEQIKK